MKTVQTCCTLTCLWNNEKKPHNWKEWPYCSYIASKSFHFPRERDSVFKPWLFWEHLNDVSVPPEYITCFSDSLKSASYWNKYSKISHLSLGLRFGNLSGLGPVQQNNHSHEWPHYFQTLSLRFEGCCRHGRQVFKYVCVYICL